MNENTLKVHRRALKLRRHALAQCTDYLMEWVRNEDSDVTCEALDLLNRERDLISDEIEAVECQLSNVDIEREEITPVAKFIGNMSITSIKEELDIRRQQLAQWYGYPYFKGEAQNMECKFLRRRIQELKDGLEGEWIGPTVEEA